MKRPATVTLFVALATIAIPLLLLIGVSSSSLPAAWGSPSTPGGLVGTRILDAITSYPAATIGVDGTPHSLRASELSDPIALAAGTHRLTVSAGRETASSTVELGDSCTALVVAAQPAGPDHPLAVTALAECPVARIPDGEASIRVLPATGATDGAVSLVAGGSGTPVTATPFTPSDRVDVAAGPITLQLTRPGRPGVVAVLQENLAPDTAYTVLMTGGSALIPVVERLIIDGVQPPAAVPAGVHINTDGPAPARRGSPWRLVFLVPVGLVAAILLLATRGRTAARAIICVLAAILLTTGCQASGSGGQSSLSTPAGPQVAPAGPAGDTAVPGSGPASSTPGLSRPTVLFNKVKAFIVVVPISAVTTLSAILPGTEVGWVDGSDPIGGPAGTTVLVGHDVYAGKPAVFADLADLKPGDEVVVRHDGIDDRYTVDLVASYPKGNLPAAIWTPRLLRALVLITCGGSIDPVTGLHRLNAVVTSHLVGTTKSPI